MEVVYGVNFYFDSFLMDLHFKKNTIKNVGKDCLN